MALVTSSFSKRIKVLGEERDLEMLFEALKFIRARDSEIHDFLIDHVTTMVIPDEKEPFGAMFSEPWGIFYNREDPTLIIHPHIIRTGKYHCAAFVIFQTAIIHGVSLHTGDIPDDPDRFTDSAKEVQILEDAIATAIDFLRRIDAPSDDIRSYEKVAVALTPAITVLALPMSGGCPMPDLIEPFEGLSDTSTKFWFTAKRFDATHSQEADRLGLSKDFSGFVLLLPFHARRNRSPEPATVGILAKISVYEPSREQGVSTGRVAFDTVLLRCNVLSCQNIDGHYVAKIKEAAPTLSKEILTSEAFKQLQELTRKLRDLILADDKASAGTRREARAELPSDPYLFFCRAIRLLQFDTNAREFALGLPELTPAICQSVGSSLIRAIKYIHDTGSSALPRKEGYQIFSETFCQWFGRLGPAAEYKQSELRKLIGDSSEESELQDERIVFPDGKSFRVQALGYHDFDGLGWTWGWAPQRGFSASITSSSHQLKHLGEEFKIPELTAPYVEFLRLTLSPDAPSLVKAFALVASALCGADGYHLHVGSKGVMAILIFDTNNYLKELPSHPSQASQISQFIMRGIPRLSIASHRDNVIEFVNQVAQSQHTSDDGNRITAFAADETCFEVVFDKGGRLVDARVVEGGTV